MDPREVRYCCFLYLTFLRSKVSFHAWFSSQNSPGAVPDLSRITTLLSSGPSQRQRSSSRPQAHTNFSKKKKIVSNLTDRHRAIGNIILSQDYTERKQSTVGYSEILSSDI